MINFILSLIFLLIIAGILILCLTALDRNIYSITKQIVSTVDNFEDKPKSRKQPTDTVILNEEFMANWKIFKGIREEFMTNWKNAIIVSIKIDEPKSVASDPSKPIQQTTPTIPTIDEINDYIGEMSNTKKTEFPQYSKIDYKIDEQIGTEKTQQLTSCMATDLVFKLDKIIPSDIQPYLNALNWMNTSLSASHADLKNILKGISDGPSASATNVEGFDNGDTDLCSKISQCDKGVKENIQEHIDKLTKWMAEINKNQELMTAMQLNKDLVAKSKAIEDAAKSGDLFGVKQKEFNKFTMSSDYDKYKKQYANLYAIKQHIEEVNHNMK
jgi:hypothetical protein